MTESRKYPLRQYQDPDTKSLADSLGATMLETPRQPSPSSPQPPPHLDHAVSYQLGRFMQNSPPPSSPSYDNDFQSQQQQKYTSRARMSNDSVHTVPVIQGPRQVHHRRSSTTDGMTPRPSIASASNASVHTPSPQSVRALRGPSSKAMPPLPRHSLPSSMAPPHGTPRTRALMRPVYPALLSRVAEAFQARITLSERAKDGLAYKDAFDGREAVALLTQIIKTTDRNLALLLGRALDAQKFFHDVTYDHRLRDSANEVYQFRTALPTPFMSGDELATATNGNGSAQPDRDCTGIPASTPAGDNVAGPVRPNISPIAGQPTSATSLSPTATQAASTGVHADDGPPLPPLPVAVSMTSVAESFTSGGTPLSPVSTNEDGGSLPPYPGESVGTASVDSHGHPQPQRLDSDQSAAPPSPTMLLGSDANASALRPSPSEALDAATAAATAAASDEIPLPSGVFTLLTECYSPTCTKDRLCYSIACPRRLEQQARLNMKPQPVLKRAISEESLGDLVVSDTNALSYVIWVAS